MNRRVDVARTTALPAGCTLLAGCTFLAGCVLLAGCTLRAPLPPPRRPLAATSAAALPGAPSEPLPSSPFRMSRVEHTLSNGMRVHLSRGAPNGVVTVAFVSRAVTRWDPRVPSELSSLMSATLLRATRLDDGTVVDDHLERLGFTPDVMLSSSAVTVVDRLLAEELPTYLEALDQSLREPVFRNSDVLRARALREESWSVHRLTHDGVLDERLPGLLYAPEDPRSRTIAARLEVLRTLTAPSLAARHQDLLDPAQCAVLIVGDVQPGTILPIVGQHFASWPAHPVGVERTAPIPLDVAGPRGFGLVSPLVRSYIKLVEHAPSALDPDHAAFLVLEQLLGAMFGARLNLELREQDGVSYGFHARYHASAENGELELVTAVENRATAHAVARIVEELRRMRGEAGHIEPFEFRLAQTRARESLLGDVDRTSGLAVRAAQRVAMGLSPDALSETVHAIDALDAAAVEAAAQRWIRPDRAPLAVVGSAGVIRSVQEAGVGELTTERPPRR
ncbi:MAG: M16 family metallopeptidase [Sandaracinaceae bacterium]